MRPFLLLCCVLGLVAASGPGLYRGGSKVVALHANNFEKLVKQSDAVWFVKFYAPWCGHCRNTQARSPDLETRVR